MSSYIEQYKKLHYNQLNFGNSSAKYIDEVSLMINFLKPNTILDYGCGKGALIDAISKKYPHIEVLGYDPAIPERMTIPNKKIDFIVNTDVLEHIPEEQLPEIIESISSISQNVFFGLHHAKAKAILPNGENAHCTIKPPEWYHQLFKNYFSKVIPLKSDKFILSAVITFNVPEDILKEYNSIIDRRTKTKEKLRCYLRKILSYFKNKDTQ